MSDLHYKGENPAEGLEFFKLHRSSLRTLRRVLVREDATIVVDINGAQMVLSGLHLGHAELVDLLKLAGASYNPATVHNAPTGTDNTKVFEVVKGDPWGQDRVA